MAAVSARYPLWYLYLAEQVRHLNQSYAWLRHQGFVAINAMALNAAISGSVLVEREACLVMMMALPLGSIVLVGATQRRMHEATLTFI